MPPSVAAGGWGVDWATSGVLLVAPDRGDLLWELQWSTHTPLQHTAWVEAVTLGSAESREVAVPALMDLGGAGAVVGLLLIGRDPESGAEAARRGAPRRTVAPDGVTLWTDEEVDANDGQPDGVEVHIIELEGLPPAVHQEEEAGR